MEEIPIRAKEGLHLVVNRETDPLFIYLDYDARWEEVNMEFQHFHLFYEMMILTEKNAGHLIEGQYYNLEVGDIVLLKPGILHKTVYFGHEPTKRFIIRFRFESLEADLRSARTVLSLFNQEVPIIRLPVEERNELISLLFDMYYLRRDNPDYQEVEIYSMLISFLCKLYQARGRNQYTNEIFDKLSHKIFSITSYIHKNYPENLNLEELSERFFISPCYLSRKFKEISGFSLVQYIQMTRIRNAQKLLFDSDDSIQMIAEKCGFTSFSQFNRVFNKYCTMSPRLFRKRSREGKIILKLDR